MATAALNIRHRQHIQFMLDPETPIFTQAQIAGSRLSAAQRDALVLSHRTTEQRRILNGPTATEYRVWPWGGGLVHVAAMVPDFAFVGVSATIFAGGRIGMRTKVYGNARIFGSVQKNATVRGNAVVQAEGHVTDSAIVGGNADIGDLVWIGGSVRVAGDMILRGRLKFNGFFTLCGDFTVENAGSDAWRVMIGSEIIVRAKGLRPYLSIQADQP